MANWRALVADDDTDLLALVSEALHRFGTEVVAVGSGDALLDKLAHDGAFDVIVTDISMPWMTGLHVMRSARTAGLRVPVIVMTALRDPTLPEQVMALGEGAQLLQKPFSLEALHAALRQCLAQPVANEQAQLPPVTRH